MAERFLAHLRRNIEEADAAGLRKEERVILSPQGTAVDVATSSRPQHIINLCANNYLGLSGDPALAEIAKRALDRHGYGLSSVRFICGTQDVHVALEAALAAFLGVEGAILYSSCFDANTGLFETLLDENDAIISDALNHASIIDGIRLCKARRHRYANNDMAELETQLRAAQDARFRLVATDGVFSMDGVVANLPAICDLAERYDAMVMVDDSHAVGFMGLHGRGTVELLGVEGRVDILTGTLGKALGGASGGYVAGRREVIEWLRQRSRPYLFSNALAPVIAATSLEVLKMVEDGSVRRAKLAANARRFREGLERLGFALVPGRHPIIPVMLGEATVVQRMARALFDCGVYAVGFSYPVVPQGKARIRTQMSAAHTDEQIDFAIDAFERAGRTVGVIQ